MTVHSNGSLWVTLHLDIYLNKHNPNKSIFFLLLMVSNINVEQFIINIYTAPWDPSCFKLFSPHHVRTRGVASPPGLAVTRGITAGGDEGWGEGRLCHVAYHFKGNFSPNANFRINLHPTSSVHNCP